MLQKRRWVVCNIFISHSRRNHVKGTKKPKSAKAKCFTAVHWGNSMCAHSQRFPGPWHLSSLACCGTCQDRGGPMSKVTILKKHRKHKAAYGRVNAGNPTVMAYISRKQSYVKQLLQLCHVSPKPTQSDLWQCHTKHCPLLGVQKHSCADMLSPRDLSFLCEDPALPLPPQQSPWLSQLKKPAAKFINLLPSRQSKLFLSSVVQRN